MITENQIKQAAEKATENRYQEKLENMPAFSSTLESASGYFKGHEDGGKWMQSQQPEWITINLEETETLPNDFEPVLCWTTDNNLQVLMMLKYSGGVDCYEWETQGLKPNKAFPIDYVVKWIFIDDPTS